MMKAKNRWIALSVFLAIVGVLIIAVLAFREVPRRGAEVSGGGHEVMVSRGSQHSEDASPRSTTEVLVISDDRPSSPTVEAAAPEFFVTLTILTDAPADFEVQVVDWDAKEEGTWNVRSGQPVRIPHTSPEVALLVRPSPSPRLLPKFGVLLDASMRGQQVEFHAELEREGFTLGREVAAIAGRGVVRLDTFFVGPPVHSQEPATVPESGGLNCIIRVEECPTGTILLKVPPGDLADTSIQYYLVAGDAAGGFDEFHPVYQKWWVLRVNGSTPPPDTIAATGTWPEGLVFENVPPNAYRLLRIEGECTSARSDPIHVLSSEPQIEVAEPMESSCIELEVVDGTGTPLGDLQLRAVRVQSAWWDGTQAPGYEDAPPLVYNEAGKHYELSCVAPGMYLVVGGAEGESPQTHTIQIPSLPDCPRRRITHFRGEAKVHVSVEESGKPSTSEVRIFARDSSHKRVSHSVFDGRASFSLPCGEWSISARHSASGLVQSKTVLMPVAAEHHLEFDLTAPAKRSVRIEFDPPLPQELPGELITAGEMYFEPFRVQDSVELQLPSGLYLLTLMRVPIEHLEVTEAPEQTFRLSARALSISGSVVDQEERPVPNALVRIRRVLGEEGFFTRHFRVRMSEGRAASNKEGFFENQYLVAGEYEAICEASGYQRSMQIVEAGSEPIKFVLQRGASTLLAATIGPDNNVVWSSTRQVIQGERKFSPSIHEVQSVDGEIVIECLEPGKCQLTIVPGDPRALVAAPMTTEEFVLKPGRNRQVFRYEPGGLVDVSLTTPEGLPASGASIALLDAAGQPVPLSHGDLARADSMGRALLSWLRPGTYQLVAVAASDSGGDLLSAKREVEVVAGKALAIELELTPNGD